MTDRHSGDVARRAPESAPPPRRSAYRREIAAVLSLKAAALALLYFLFFSAVDRPAATEQAVARHLLATPASVADGETTHDR